MKPGLRWTLAALVGLAVLAVGAGVVFSRSERALQARYTALPSPVRADMSSAGVTAGGHLTTVANCIGCHRASLTGEFMGLAGSTIYAPNLTVVAKSMTDAQLDQAIRQGLRPDGTSELGMPSQAYAALTDTEVGQIIGYLRSQPSRGAELARPAPGWVQRLNIAGGGLETEAVRIAKARPPIEAGGAFETGRHLAMVSCASCHGTDLSGGGGLPAPDLTVRGYYSKDQFRTLLRTGVGLDEDMALMSQTAQTSFSHFSDSEIDAIYDYLIARDQVLASLHHP